MLTLYEKNKIKAIMDRIGSKKYPRPCPQIKGSLEYYQYMDGVQDTLKLLCNDDIDKHEFTEYMERLFKGDHKDRG